MDTIEKVAVLDNEVQAQLLDSILTERSIPHVMKSYHDSAYDGLFQGQRGWGHVEAPLEFKDEILAILADLDQDETAP
jgi:hypothetical protein